jgi:Domain of unknown function (DUF4168)
MTFRKHARASMFFIAAASMAAMAPGAMAQQQDEQTVPPPEARQPAAPAAAAAPIAEAKIDKFADAYVAVQDIQSKAAQKLEGTTDPAQAQQVRSSAETEMIQAVKQTGLEVEEFNQIVQAMAQDADLRTRVTAKVQERTKG